MLLRNLLSLRAALNAVFAGYLLLSPILPRMDAFVQIGYYLAADGALALSLAAAAHRVIHAPVLAGGLVADALVRLAFGSFMVIFPTIGLLPTTRVLFAAALAIVTLLVGLIGIAYVVWSTWLSKDPTPAFIRRLILLSSTCLMLFAITLVAGAEFGAHSQHVVAAYAFVSGLLLFLAALQTRTPANLEEQSFPIRRGSR